MMSGIWQEQAWMGSFQANVKALLREIILFMCGCSETPGAVVLTIHNKQRARCFRIF